MWDRRGVYPALALLCLYALIGGATPPVNAAPPRAASRVAVFGGGYRYVYTVNGAPEVIRGMGYNLLPRAETDSERFDRHRRAFRAMRAAGVNTVLGWDQPAFDGVLLDAAAAEGLGVVLPFDLPPGLDYTDEGLVADLLVRIGRWVEAYRDHPALRMWGIGNEVMRDLKPRSPAMERAFARFVLQAADLAHARDPDHPVVYREAEDLAVAPLAAAVAERPGARPWFVLGLNFYTFRMDEVLAGWPARGLDLPLVVTEFGALGYPPAARPVGYVQLWQTLRAYPDYVLGGFAYVWHNRGPEEVDAQFGLVDDDNSAVDGTLEALGGAFLGDAAAGVPAPPTASDPAGGWGRERPR